MPGVVRHSGRFGSFEQHGRDAMKALISAMAGVAAVAAVCAIAAAADCDGLGDLPDRDTFSHAFAVSDDGRALVEKPVTVPNYPSSSIFSAGES